MPLFIDVRRNVAGASAQDVVHAHEKDLATQGKHGVRFLKCWHDSDAGKIFCLVEAPSPEAARAVHSEAHGLVAEEIYRVERHTYPSLEAPPCSKQDRRATVTR